MALTVRRERCKHRSHKWKLRCWRTVAYNRECLKHVIECWSGHHAPIRARGGPDTCRMVITMTVVVTQEDTEHSVALFFAENPEYPTVRVVATRART